MIDAPHIAQSAAQLTATIHLTIPRDQIQHVMGPAIGEVVRAIAAQGISPAGPVFSYHLHLDPATFDFEVGVPVSSPFQAAGRVQPSQLPAVRVARTIYRGSYEGLGPAWGEFCGWIKTQKLAPTPNLWEVYLTGPESSLDPATWQTELNQPLRS